MKYIIALVLLVSISCGQEFVNSGTGVKGISFQYDKSVYGTLMAEGCYFMASWVIGGLGTDAQIKSAYNFALSKGFINRRAWVTGCSGDYLAKQVSMKYGTQYHNGWTLKKGCNHWWVLNERGQEVFNAAGLGRTGCKK